MRTDIYILCGRCKTSAASLGTGDGLTQFRPPVSRWVVASWDIQWGRGVAWSGHPVPSRWCTQALPIALSVSRHLPIGLTVGIIPKHEGKKSNIELQTCSFQKRGLLSNHLSQCKQTEYLPKEGAVTIHPCGKGSHGGAVRPVPRVPGTRRSSPGRTRSPLSGQGAKATHGFNVDAIGFSNKRPQSATLFYLPPASH